MFTPEFTNKLKSVPEGQTEESFIDSKINQINRSIEVFSIILDDVDYFEDDTAISIKQINILLVDLANRLDKLKK